ncbi:MAG: polysaccharide deacetylase family protein [Bacteroidetes bacterium]|nr:polysaccharide deacetylase family protein [Bacteroidota bacterium]
MRLPSRPPVFLQKIFKHCHWSFPNNENKIYLTFDDGPTPEVLPFILKTLDEYKIKATFFCVGDNIKKHPALANELLEKGHSIGNHTQHHVNGWTTSNALYFKEIEDFEKTHQTQLFRPPYGRIKKSQERYLSRQHHIIMWDVLSYDYDKKINAETCYKNVIENTRSGSIIVFHDNIKAFSHLQYALPKSLDFLLKKGFLFETIPDAIPQKV